MKNIFCLAIVLFLIFSRFWNVEKTARFMWDESSDVVHMWEIWKKGQITPIGPISEDGVKVFGSISYYMTLPFMVIGKFDPVWAVYATGFWNIVAICLLGLFLEKKFKTNRILWLIVFGISSPWLIASRWAWNTHFIWFWLCFGLYLSEKKSYWKYLSGICLGLSVWAHWYAFFAGFSFSLAFLFKNKKAGIAMIAGFTSALIPLALYDFIRPPGIFITRLLYFRPDGDRTSLLEIFRIFSQYILGNNGNIVNIVFWILLIWCGFKTKNKFYLWPVVVQLLLLFLVKGGVWNHYFIAVLPFFYIWIFANIRNRIVLILIGYIVFFNTITFPLIVTKTTWQTNISVTKVLVDKITESNIKKFNLAILGTDDPNTYGRKYRDLLKIKGVQVEGFDSFNKAKNAFFISYLDWSKLRYEPNYELQNFRNDEARLVYWNNETGEKLYYVEDLK